jgi:hypothetical protein
MTLALKKKKIDSRRPIKIKRRRRSYRLKLKRIKKTSMIERIARIARSYAHRPVSQKRRWLEKGRPPNRSQCLKF